jgi:hypothetical protein
MAKIHRQIIATGREWKPCVECGRPFEEGEVLTAVDTESNAGVSYWYGEQCTQKLFGHLLSRRWRQTWKCHRRKSRNQEIDWNQAG